MKRDRVIKMLTLYEGYSLDCMMHRACLYHRHRFIYPKQYKLKKVENLHRAGQSDVARRFKLCTMYLQQICIMKVRVQYSVHRPTLCAIPSYREAGDKNPPSRAKHSADTHTDKSGVSEPQGGGAKMTIPH